MNDLLSQAKTAFQKEKGLSLVEWGGLVALMVGFTVIGFATYRHFYPPYRGTFHHYNTSIGTATS